MNLENELYDIYGYWHVPFWQTKLFFYGLIAVVLMPLLALLAWLLYRWMRRANPTDQALCALNALKKKNITDAQTFKEFHYEYTSIIKRFLADTYQLPLVSATDKELLDWALQKEVPGLRSLQTLINAGNTVKYAQSVEWHEECKQLLSIAKIFIQKESVSGKKTV